MNSTNCINSCGPLEFYSKEAHSAFLKFLNISSTTEKYKILQHIKSVVIVSYSFYQWYKEKTESKNSITKIMFVLIKMYLNSEQLKVFY